MIQAATAEAVRTLLRECHLPVSDLSDSHLEHFFARRNGDALEGVVGLELYPPYALLRSLALAPIAPPADVVDEDGEDEPEAADRGAEEEQDRESRVAEEAEGSFHPHQERGAHDQRREHEPEGDAVRHLLHAFHEAGLVERLD